MEDKDKLIAELKAYKDVNEDFKTAWEELKAENKKLKFKLDTAEADYEASKIEIEDLKNELNFQTIANNHLLELYEHGQKELAVSKQLADKYLGCLQEIKAIVEKNISYQDTDSTTRAMTKIIDFITKAESEG